MTRRAGQVASELRRAVQTILDRGLQDPRITEALITVTEVRVGQDLRNATVMVSIMPEARENLAMHGLRAAAGFIRREVGKLMEIRRVPELTFKLDKSVKKQAEVLEAIARASEERQESDEPGAAGSEPGAGAGDSEPGNPDRSGPPA